MYQAVVPVDAGQVLRGTAVLAFIRYIAEPCMWLVDSTEWMRRMRVDHLKPELVMGMSFSDRAIV